MNQNVIWKLEAISIGQECILCPWLFKLKKDKNVNILKFKKESVCQKSKQNTSLEYFDTFIRVVRFFLIKLW